MAIVHKGDKVKDEKLFEDLMNYSRKRKTLFVKGHSGKMSSKALLGASQSVRKQGSVIKGFQMQPSL
jgi:hypothetical protein